MVKNAHLRSTIEVFVHIFIQISDVNAAVEMHTFDFEHVLKFKEI